MMPGFVQVASMFWIAVGVWMLARSVRSRRRGAASVGWPSVGGVVIRSERHSDSDGDPFPAVEVTYRAAGRSYRLRQPYFGERWFGDEATQRILTMHPVGAHVSVHYLPRNPAIATTMPGEVHRRTGDILTGAGLVVFFVFLLIFSCF